MRAAACRPTRLAAPRPLPEIPADEQRGSAPSQLRAAHSGLADEDGKEMEVRWRLERRPRGHCMSAGSASLSPTQSLMLCAVPPSNTKFNHLCVSRLNETSAKIRFQRRSRDRPTRNRRRTSTSYWGLSQTTSGAPLLTHSSQSRMKRNGTRGEASL